MRNTKIILTALVAVLIAIVVAVAASMAVNRTNEQSQPIRLQAGAELLNCAPGVCWYTVRHRVDGGTQETATVYMVETNGDQKRISLVAEFPYTTE